MFELIQDNGVTTLATPRSQTTSAGSVYHARLEKDSIIETRDSRYKEWIKDNFEKTRCFNWFPSFSLCIGLLGCFHSLH